MTVEAGGDLVENDPTFHTDVDRNLFDKIPSGKRVVVAEFAGYAFNAGNRCRFQRPVPRAGRSRGEFVFRRWPADHRPAKQGLLEPDSARFDSIDGSHLGRAAGGIRRQDQRCDCGDHALGSGRDHASRQRDHFLRDRLEHPMWRPISLTAGKKWGNFISASGLNSGRFLDPPEFAVMHDKGNEENLFDRVDYQLSTADSIHLNFGYSRSWFQTPNSFDAENATPWNGLVGIEPQMAGFAGIDPNGNVVGPTDQRSKIETFNIAPSWTRLLNANAVFTLGAFVRRDEYNYYPSGNPFADLGPPSLQRESVSQNRTLTNAGLRSDISYVKGNQQHQGRSHLRADVPERERHARDR